MKRLLGIIACLIWSAAASAAGPQLEIGVGVTHATPQENMTWWQNCEHDGCPYKLKMNSPSLSVGAKWVIDKEWLGFDRFNVRAGGEYLGRFRSSAIATASDLNYGTCRYIKDACWPMSHWYGVGDVAGLYLTVQPEIDMSHYAIFFEGGVSVYYSTWKVDIPDWRPTADGPVQSLTATHKARVQYTYIIGGGVRRGPLSVSLTRRDARAGGDLFPAIYHGPAYNLSARWTF